MKMQCFPFYSLLLAMDSPTVDFFSLDIEVSLFTIFERTLNFPQKGPELEVLQTIPWTKVLSVFSLQNSVWKCVSQEISFNLRWTFEQSAWRQSFSP